MVSQRHREETINTQLAFMISRLGVKADAETILVHGKERPDVLFELRGLRFIIEAKYDDYPNAHNIVLNDARGRVQRGLAHVAAAVLYPKSLRNVPTSELAERLETSSLAYRIISETGESEWFDGSPVSLMDALRRAQEAMAQDDIVEQTANSLSDRLDGIAQLWIGQIGVCDRLSDILGMTPPKGESKEKADDRRAAAAKVAALIIANGLIFQEQLASSDGRITPLRKLETEKDTVRAALNHWRWIWQNIDYVPVFQLGERVLEELPSIHSTLTAFRALLKEAMDICARQSALRHDLMGRIYHHLLHHAKYLGTYYTSVSAATLLLKLALAAKWEKDFGDPVELSSFKIADLACGTGTLLMASAQAISDAYIRARADTDRSLNPVDLQTLHRAIMENIIHGYDVLPSAVHLTASTLAMLAPEVAFVRMNLYVMPMGLDGNTPRLGSLDFLSGSRLQTQIALDHSQSETIRTGAGMSQITNAVLPELDLCVMNPPFVRNVFGNLLFGSLPDERGKLKDELKKRVKKIEASITAGLGAVFVALADKHLKSDGRIAFVLPIAITTGEAWSKTRALISRRYHLETVIASHDSERPNFSENTSLSEILFIARRIGAKEKPGNTTFINLWRNPRSIHEALDLAARIVASKPIDISETGSMTISAERGKLAEIVSMPAPIGEENWTGALFAQTELLRTYEGLEKGILRIPGIAKPQNVPLCRMDDLAEIGPDYARIKEGFDVSLTDWSAYPGFWNHDSDMVRAIQQKRNSWLIPRKDSPRGPNYGAHLWERAGNILVVSRLRTNTQRLIAIGFKDRVLGSTWWSLKCKKLSQKQRKSFLLWLNGSMSLLLYFGRRAITQGPWMQMKQPAWASMPVIDVRVLSKARIDALAKAYDRLATKDLQALAKLDVDKTRIAIDSAICAALKLPDLKMLRELFTREPGLTGKPIISQT